MASGATEVTVSAMANHSSATVVINPADADANTAGHQVTLDSGDTDITVTVTAADGLTTRDYALTVRREASPQGRHAERAVAERDRVHNPVRQRHIFVRG